MPIRINKPRYYAVEWTEGFAKYDENDERVGQYYSFPTPGARAKWTEDGPTIQSTPGYRSEVSSNCPKLRIVTRNAYRRMKQITAL